MRNDRSPRADTMDFMYLWVWSGFALDPSLLRPCLRHRLGLPNNWLSSSLSNGAVHPLNRQTRRITFHRVIILKDSTTSRSTRIASTAIEVSKISQTPTPHLQAYSPCHTLQVNIIVCFLGRLLQCSSSVFGTPLHYLFR